MKKIKLIPFVIITCFYLNALNAQRSTNYDVSGEWIVGVGINIIEDNGKKFNTGSSTNFSIPVIISAEYNFTSQFSVNGSFSANKYVAGKVVDSGIIQEGREANYSAFDVATKFYFRDILNNYVIEPYIMGGLGYTNIGSYTVLYEKSNSNELREIPSVGRVTLNTGIGANYWFSRSFGMNVNFLGKFGVKSGENKDFISNQMQFSLGVFYSFKIYNWRS
ncbi:MAG: hypothetical protein IZT56_14645 [Bacteroidetes bacterium]|nr:hypothetical protein [Bacteroidota bacterium]